MYKKNIKVVKVVSELVCGHKSSFAKIEIISVVDSEEKAFEIVAEELTNLMRAENKKFREGKETKHAPSEVSVSFNNLWSDSPIYRNEKIVGGEIVAIDYDLNKTTVTRIFYV